MLRVFLPAAALLLSLPAFAAEAAARLADTLASARSLTANFEQTVTGASGAGKQISHGTMAVSRPQLFRWEVRSPFEQLIVADGREVWVYDPDLAQAVVRAFDTQLSDTPALLFGGDAKRIGERFTVTVLEDKAGRLRFELKPRSADALFESLRVGFRDGKISEMTLLDNLGQSTAIAFSQVVLNPALSASRFVFTPPAGTDVVREQD